MRRGAYYARNFPDPAESILLRTDLVHLLAPKLELKFDNRCQSALRRCCYQALAESNSLRTGNRTRFSRRDSTSWTNPWHPRRDSNPDSETENLTNWPVIRQGLKLFTEFQRHSVYCLTGCSRYSMRLRLFARTNWLPG